MNICKNCGKEVAEEFKHCNSCGAEIEEVTNGNVEIQPTENTVEPSNINACEGTKDSFQAIKDNIIGIFMKNKIITIVICVLVAVIGVVIVSDNSLTEPSANLLEENKMTYEEAYIEAAKSIMSEFIINPSSAVFYQTNVVETDNCGRAIVYLDFSAENTVGGSNRSRVYVCVQEVDLDGNYKFYRDYCYVSVSSSDASYMAEMKITTLKNMNNFGE